MHYFRNNKKIPQINFRYHTSCLPSQGKVVSNLIIFTDFAFPDSITITQVSSCLNIGDNNSELMNYDAQGDSDTNQNEFQSLTIKDKIMRAIAVLDSTTGCTLEELQKYLDVMYLYNNMHSSALKKYVQQLFSDGSIIQVTGKTINCKLFVSFYLN